MTDAGLLNVVVALVAGLAGVFGTWLARPKVVAEANLASAEAAKTAAEVVVIEWSRFQTEIARQDAKIAAMEEKLLRQDAEIENLKHDRDDRDDKLVVERKENRALVAKLSRIETRLGKIEALLKLHPLTPELQADLDKLNND